MRAGRRLLLWYSHTSAWPYSLTSNTRLFSSRARQSLPVSGRSISEELFFWRCCVRTLDEGSDMARFSWQRLGKAQAKELSAVCACVCGRSVSCSTANLPQGLFCSAIQGSSLGGSPCHSSSLQRSSPRRSESESKSQRAAFFSPSCHPIIPSAPSSLLASLGSLCPSAKAAKPLRCFRCLLLTHSCNRSAVSNLK